MGYRHINGPRHRKTVNRIGSGHASDITAAAGAAVAATAADAAERTSNNQLSPSPAAASAASVLSALSRSAGTCAPATRMVG